MNETTSKRWIHRVLVKTKKIATNFILWLFTSRGIMLLLLSGILVSLIANLIDDMVKRQRYLELLQYEIHWHMSFASRLSSQNGENNYSYFNEHFIPSKFYQAVLNSGYLVSINPRLFLEITTYYELVNLANQRLERHYKYYDQLDNNFVICGYTATSSADISLCDEHKKILDKAQKFITEREEHIWNDTVNWIYDNQIDKKFNPTQDRLNSPILRLLMNNNTIAEANLK